jgi:hypothetical protein
MEGNLRLVWQQGTNAKGNSAHLQALVIPVVTLSAVNSAGQQVSTNVSPNEAIFVTGVFSNITILSGFNKAQLAVNAVVADLKNGTVAFVLPGTGILIFPIGLAVTGTWFAIGLVAYGIGTYDRIQYAQSFKQRSRT